LSSLAHLRDQTYRSIQWALGRARRARGILLGELTQRRQATLDRREEAYDLSSPAHLASHPHGGRIGAGGVQLRAATGEQAFAQLVVCSVHPLAHDADAQRDFALKGAFDGAALAHAGDP
jgi:hypothetical protein